MQPRKLSSIKSRVSLHDRSQVEVTFSYALQEKKQQDDHESKDPAYQVDAYFFFPAQMRINSETYPKERFYHDLRAFVRLREPRLSYKELIGETEQNSEQSPITFIRMYLKSMQVGANWESVEVAFDEARLFGCSYSSYMYRRTERRRRALERLARGMVKTATATDPDLMRRTLTAIRKLSTRGFRLLRSWRDLMVMASGIADELDAGLRQELNFVNEYCSYAYRDSMIVLLQGLDQLRDVYPAPEVIRLRRRLLASLRLERWYSRKMGYFWVEAESSFEYQERYVSHRSALKRRVWSVLYLDARSKPLFAIQRQFGAMLSAGLAATWAITAEIMVRQRAIEHGKGAGLLSMDLGLGGFLLLTALIMAYVLKDRIKELGRSYFTFKIFKGIPDNSNHISFGTAFGETRSIGVVKETASFESKSKLPEEIRSLRERKSQEHVDPEELYKSVLHYRKKIFLRRNALRDLPQPVRAVHDILRVSVSSYLARLDESLHRAVVLNERQRAEEILMPKVYHLDIVLKYSSLSDDKAMAEPIYDYIRLFINKEGLLRIKQLH